MAGIITSSLFFIPDHFHSLTSFLLLLEFVLKKITNESIIQYLKRSKKIKILDTYYEKSITDTATPVIILHDAIHTGDCVFNTVRK